MFAFHGEGLFSTWGLVNNDMPADELVGKARQAGVSWIAGQYYPENIPYLPGLHDACVGAGIAFGVWDSDPTASRAHDSLSYGIQFYIAESEGKPVDWASLLGALPDDLPFAVITNFSGLDNEMLIARGAICIPECYLPDNPQATPDAQTFQANQRGYTQVACCLGCYHDYPLTNYQELADYSIWAAETMTEADWNELARRVAPPPQPPNGGGEVPDEKQWWEKGYPGGPMVKVKGFPRPLYPPDAARYGKQPSANGKDVEAYKRTVSRAGRWPWQPFDQAYSNNFAHGKSGGNVKDSGVAGTQRQGKIDDTGWVGKTTFNFWRSIIIPEGLPHAGEPAMDATAVKLINQAWDEFGGKEPAPEAIGTLRQLALREAISELGETEHPPNSNSNKYTDWYGMVGPWCAMFVTWCFEHAGDSPSFVKGQRYSYVPYIVGDAQFLRYGLKTVDDPIPGDLVCYDWQGDTIYDHVGIFEAWTTIFNEFTCIEGNTSYADNSNGGEVMRRTRNRSSQGTVFVRVAEP